MKWEPNERGQTHDRPNLIEKPVAEALFACRHATREERGGEGEEEKRRRERRKLRCSQLRHKRPRTHLRRDPSYDESIQGHPRKKEGEERKEREKEREREGEKRKEKGRCSQLRTSVQGHTSERGVNLSITFRNTPR